MKRKVEMAIRRIDRFLEGSRVRLVPGKTEAIIFHREHRRVTGLIFEHGQVEIIPARTVNYLGVWFDDNMFFGEHVWLGRTLRDALRPSKSLCLTLGVWDQRKGSCWAGSGSNSPLRDTGMERDSKNGKV